MNRTCGEAEPYDPERSSGDAARFRRQWNSSLSRAVLILRLVLAEERPDSTAATREHWHHA